MFNSHELSRRNRGSRSHALSFLFSQTHLLKSFTEVTLPFMFHLWRGKLLKLQWVHGKPHVERQGFSLCGFGTFSHQAIWNKCGFNIASSKTIVSISMKKKKKSIFLRPQVLQLSVENNNGPSGLIEFKGLPEPQGSAKPYALLIMPWLFYLRGPDSFCSLHLNIS